MLPSLTLTNGASSYALENNLPSTLLDFGAGRFNCLILVLTSSSGIDWKSRLKRTIS